MGTNTEWVELRVHGVSGTPADSLLAHPNVAQTDGGGASRFFSAVDADGVVLPGKDGQALEAYHWGHYTSGTSWQALWLLLIPFGMINAAQFMLPAPATRPKRSVNAQAAASALLRLLALMLTLLLVFAMGLTLMDLVAWRWAPGSRQLASWNPSAVLMIATLLTAAVLIGLWLLGSITATSAPNITGGMTPEEARARAAERGTPLADPYFYQGTSDSPILSRLHLAAGLLLVAAMARWVRDPDSDGPIVWISLGLLLAVIIVVSLLGDPESLAVADLDESGLRMRARWHDAVARGSWVACAAGLVMIGLAMSQMPGFTPPKDPKLRVPVEGYELISVILLLTGVVGVCALVLVNWRIVATTPSTTPAADDPAWYFRPYARGWAASVVAALAVFIGVGLSASVPTAVSSLLQLTRSKVGVTPMLDRVSYGWGLDVLRGARDRPVPARRLHRSQGQARGTRPGDVRGCCSDRRGGVRRAAMACRRRLDGPGDVDRAGQEPHTGDRPDVRQHGCRDVTRDRLRDPSFVGRPARLASAARLGVVRRAVGRS